MSYGDGSNEKKDGEVEEGGTVERGIELRTVMGKTWMLGRGQCGTTEGEGVLLWWIWGTLLDFAFQSYVAWLPGEFKSSCALLFIRRHSLMIFFPYTERA